MDTYRGRGLRAAALPLLLALILTTGAAPAAKADGWSFVQVQRVNSLSMQFGTDAFATQNALGGAFASSTVQTMIQSGISSSVADGSTSWMLEMRDLADLTGTSGASFHVGVFNPTPVAPGAGNPATYDGTADRDWWYRPAASEVAADGSALQQLPASFAARTLTAGPGTVTLSTALGGVPAPLRMSSVRITAHAGESSAPLRSGNGLPPGHLPEENLPDALTSFETMTSGKLAGRVSARALAETSIPASLAGTQCAELYTATHTMLDLIVGGCRAFGFITLVSPTQPDTVDDALGAGVYRLIADVDHHVVGCNHDNVPAQLSECLAVAAYSASFQFTTDRVIDVLAVSTTKLLTVQRDGSGAGTITTSGVGIDCGDDCMERYATGDAITLGAVPSQGSRFDGWTGCDDTSGASCDLTMDADKLVSASFVAQRTLSVAIDGAGVVTSAPAGINCGTDCSAVYDDGDQVALSATAGSGSVFAGWSGACTGLGACSVAMSQDRSVGATFAEAPRPASADVAITLTGPASAPRSAQITHQIAVRNVGPDTSHNVVLTNRVSSPAKLVEATATGGSCTKPAKGIVTCALGDLDSGRSATIVVSVKVGPKAGSTASITASVSSVGDASGPATVDQDPSNNQASLTTMVAK